MTQAVRGMRDVLPVEARRLRAVEADLHDVLHSFAYEEVQFPLLEFTELFSRGVGEATDIVEKEMYTLKDRDGDSITLRPEGTAGCVRALQQHGLLYNQTQRVFYRGPMFRYERPQRGRYRQFYQLGVEVFGLAGPDIDAELLYLCAQFWRRLGIDNLVALELNSLGSSASRAAYRSALVDYLTPLREELDEESQRRLTTNPLRILDSKSAATQEVVSSAPPMASFLDDASQAHFDSLCRLLTDLGVPYNLNSKLVRGLDYYTDTVFEWTTSALGAQGTICGGGRYDGLVELLGGKPTPGAGFAMGLERVALLCEQTQDALAFEDSVDVYCCVMEPGQQSWAQNVTQTLRDALPGLRMRVHAGGGKLKTQLKKADVSGARWALIVGGDEVADNKVTVKAMSGQIPQQTLAVTELIELMNRSTGD
jgi:histidyl-tRNA synthetase